MTSPAVLCCLVLPVECREVSEPRLSFESTRRVAWPANRFMVSVTAPGGCRARSLSPTALTRHEQLDGDQGPRAPGPHHEQRMTDS
ncbi:hypothetical protein DY245_05410 [Streptomyces inhibens]|uniref:Uncharacterized protein n=1 Tax=Streptomyces inhibens TaxID=2293571 RepID=A0A371QA14_STRIH|nr:hypothetical protein DY245_05410 [Streptomyces inhibens]